MIVVARQASSISLLAAWRIPGVASFAATLFFCKLVAYTFLYWLPFYLSTTEIGGRRLSPQARTRCLPLCTFSLLVLCYSLPT